VTAGQDWVEQALRLVESLRAPAGEGAAAPGAAGDCRWCPLCQAAAVLRGERPEVTAALADVLTSTAAALRAFAGEAAPGAAAGAAADAPDAPAEPAPQPPAVQRIELG
jgi:hypothetical protein